MSNIKYELVKETNYEGKTMFYTKLDGYYVSDSLSYDENKARELYNVIIERGHLKPIVEVLDTKYNEQ